MMLRLCWIFLSLYVVAAAQDFAPDRLVNVLMEKTPTSGILVPQPVLLLSSTGFAYRFRSGEPLLVESAYLWTKTGANTGTLEVPPGSEAGPSVITLSRGLIGTYRDPLASGTIRFIPFDAPSPAPLRNLSSRLTIASSQPAIVGFVVNGSTPRRVLVRAVGPGLAGFGVAAPLANPVLTLFRQASPIAANDGWGNSAELSTAFAAVGAFSIAANSRDCALLASLPAGAYTAQVRGDRGEVLIEVYFVD